MPKRLPTIEISGLPTAETGAASCRVIPLPRQPLAMFDSLETRFFEQGDAIATESGEQDALLVDEPAEHGSRRKVIIIGLACAVGLTAACATWAMGHQRDSSSSSAPVAAVTEKAPTAEPAANATEPLPASSTPEAPAAERSIPSPPPATAGAAAFARDNDPNSKPTATATTAEAPSAPAAAAPAAEAPAALVPEAPAAPAAPAAAPDSVATAKAVAAGAGPAATDGNAESLEACKEAARGRQRKDLLATCTRAFANNPSSAEVAATLAKAEFDRGHARQALDWAKKAIALDQGLADAYVFLGGAEQAMGHAGAAKAAYKQYLQLSPRGRYAADLRAVLSSL